MRVVRCCGGVVWVWLVLRKMLRLLQRGEILARPGTDGRLRPTTSPRRTPSTAGISAVAVRTVSRHVAGFNTWSETSEMELKRSPS